ncbi:MAG: SulP family inorganic anion transporter [Actinomycetaceae bacterium]
MTGAHPVADGGRAGRARRLAARARSLLPGPRDYRDLRRTWRKDVLAGVTVGIVALPLALGFGVSSGLSAEHGLVTAIVAGLLAAVFGGSHVQVSGPTGAMVVVLVPIVATQGPGAIAVVTLMAGVLVVAAGLLRLGRAVSVIPWPVIEGFTFGIAVTIFMQQVPLVAAPGQGAADERSSNATLAAVQALGDADLVHLAWALGAVAIVALCMVLGPRLHASVPGSLLGIVVVAVLAAFVESPLSTIGTIPSSLPAPSLPAVELDALGGLLAPAVAVAALAAIESLLSARVAAGLASTGPYDADRELVGQGIASVGASLFGGMPATGAIARTSVNVRAGGRTRLASVVHALVLLAIVFVAAGPVSRIPHAALAGVLFVTAWRMVPVPALRSVLAASRSSAVTFAVTAIITISFDLVVAVLIGVALAAVLALRVLSRSSTVSVEPVESEDPDDRGIVTVAFSGPLFFVSAERIFETLMQVEGARVVILRMSRLDLVDATGARTLSDIVRGLERRDITVLLKGVRPEHAELFRGVGVLDALRHHRHLFAELEPALEHARSHVRRERAAREEEE